MMNSCSTRLGYCVLYYVLEFQLKKFIIVEKSWGIDIIQSIAKKSFSIQNYVEFTKEHGIQLKLIQVRTYIIKFLGIVVKSFSELVMEFIFVLAISVILCYIF